MNDQKRLLFLSPIHRATRQIGLYLEERMDRLGLTNDEGHLLSFLLSYAPSPVGELARVFGVKGSTLTSRLDRLERRGLLTRRAHPEDRRSFLVEPTRAGRDLGRKVRREVEDLESGIGAHVAEGTLEGFEAVLEAIARATDIQVR